MLPVVISTVQKQHGHRKEMTVGQMVLLKVVTGKCRGELSGEKNLK